MSKGKVKASRIVSLIGMENYTNRNNNSIRWNALEATSSNIINIAMYIYAINVILAFLFLSLMLSKMFN